METVEVVIRGQVDVRRLPDLLKILGGSSAASVSAGPQEVEPAVPPSIVLLQEYENHGGQATQVEAMKLNGTAYRDARGAGGMYTPAAGYFEWDRSAKVYKMTNKARRELDAWRKTHPTQPQP